METKISDVKLNYGDKNISSDLIERITLEMRNLNKRTPPLRKEMEPQRMVRIIKLENLSGDKRKYSVTDIQRSLPRERQEKTREYSFEGSYW